MELNLSSIKQSRYYLIIFILTFIVYGNTLNNEYSLDDNIVVDGNKMVEKGISAIPEIFTSRYSTDKKQSYDYRPVVITTFALEKQFFKKLPPFQTKEQKERKDKLTQANISHFVNVLLYAYTCILLFIVLQVIISSHSVLFSFIITVLFLAHPLHTEVVCSLKNRDEIIVFIAVLLSLKHIISYAKNNTYKNLIFAVLFFCLAMFTKANGLALIALVPIVLYFVKANYKTILIAFVSMFAMLVIVRVSQKFLVSGENQVRMFKYFENPLMHEDWSIKRWSAALYCNWFYFKSLIFPKDMSYYYGYNQIPIATWGFWQVWVSLCITFGLGAYGFYLFLKRKIIGLGIVLCFGLMMGINNFWILLPGIVADRLTYMLSLGFIIMLVWGIAKLFKVNFSSENYKIKLPTTFTAIMLFIVVLYSGRTIVRNADWHDYLTLYEHDIKVVPESAKAHALISNTLYTSVKREVKNNPGSPVIQENVDKIIYHFKEAIRIDSTYKTSLNNLGSSYIDMKHDYVTGVFYCNKAIEIDKNYLEANLNLSVGYQRLNQPDSALKYFGRVFELNPDLINMYGMFNNFLTRNNMIQKGIDKLDEIAKKSENPKNIYLNMANLYSLDVVKINLTLLYFEKAFELDRSDKKLCNHIVSLYSNQGNQEKANYYSIICNQ